MSPFLVGSDTRARMIRETWELGSSQADDISNVRFRQYPPSSTWLHENCHSLPRGRGLASDRSIPFLRLVPVMVFDKTSFCRVVNEDGRAYQYQAIELIKICRAFSTASYQSPDQDIRLQRYNDSPGL